MRSVEDKHIRQGLSTDDTLSDNEATVLSCPTCGESYLHHEDVHILTYHKEDGPVGTRVSVYKGTEIVTEVGVDISHLNYSRRRDSIVITMSCESCDWVASAPFIMVQHKGITYTHMPQLQEVFMEQKVRDGYASSDEISWLTKRTVI